MLADLRNRAVDIDNLRDRQGFDRASRRIDDCRRHRCRPVRRDDYARNLKSPRSPQQGAEILGIGDVVEDEDRARSLEDGAERNVAVPVRRGQDALVVHLADDVLDSLDWN